MFSRFLSGVYSFSKVMNQGNYNVNGSTGFNFISVNKCQTAWLGGLASLILRISSIDSLFPSSRLNKSLTLFHSLGNVFVFLLLRVSHSISCLRTCNGYII